MLSVSLINAEEFLFHSSLHHCLCLLRFVAVCLCTALSLSVSVSIWLRSGLWVTATPSLFSVSVILMEICCCVWDRCPVDDTLWARRELSGQMASHLTLECFGIQRSSCSTPWLQGARVLWQQNKPKSSALHHRAWQLVWGVCADVLCLVFSKRGAVYHDLTSPIWSHISKKKRCSWNLRAKRHLTC